MKYQQLLKEIEWLPIGERKEIYSEEEDKIIIFRPEKLGRSLKNKNYDVKKNFQIILKKPNEKEFLPNHLRVLIEVNHRISKDKENSKRFFEMIEEIYSGEDPLKFKEEITEAQKNPNQVPTKRELIDTLTDSFKEIQNPHSIRGERWRNIMFQRHQEADVLRKTFSILKYSDRRDYYVKKVGEWYGVFNNITNPKTSATDRKKYCLDAHKFLLKLGRAAIRLAETPEYIGPPLGILSILTD